MANKINIVISAEDKASKPIRSVGDAIDDTAKRSGASGGVIKTLNDHVGTLAGVTAAAGAATYGLVGFMDQSINAANRYQASMTGLSSVSRAFGSDTGRATRAARELASDGLMSVADAATGLKNLLASGFSLDQAVTMMKRFKDSAAFGRQSALSFGQAVSSATEGIKNGNSILVDNAGVTKNLSIILREAGFAETDLMRATSDANVRMALFNGILKETNPQLGDAARLADSAAGKQAVWAAQTDILYQKIGLALQPALLELLRVATPVITTIADWVAKNPELAAGIIIGTTAVIGLTAAAGALGLAVIGLGPVFAMFQAVALASFSAVGAGMATLTGILTAPIIMPAIAVGAALAALGLVISKSIETANTVKDVARAIEGNRREGEKTDAAIKRLHAEGKISTDKLNTYFKNTESAAEQSKANLYSGFFGPMRQSLDDLFVRITGTKEQYKGSGYGGHALGTSYSPGGRRVVGEHGPEEMIVPRGAQITPAYRTRQMDGSGAPTQTINMYNTINNKTDYKSMLSDIALQLRAYS